jgi:hypothetical protein
MQISLILRSPPWIFVCLIAIGCSSVLGIDKARCDPALAACQPGADLCNSYCTQVMASCTGDLAQYTSLHNCQAVCGRLPPGMVGDDQVNTVQCRLHQAQLAADLSQPDKAIACPGAGPGGNGLCGTNCEGACTIITQSCTGDNVQYNGDIASCEAECATLPDQETFNSTMMSMSEGTSVQCRLWHASAAAEAGFPHCRHAAGASPCN